MSAERMERWLEEVRSSGFEAYYPMVRSMMRVPMRELSRHARAAGTELRRPRVAPFLPGRVFIREDGPIDRLARYATEKYIVHSDRTVEAVPHRSQQKSGPFQGFLSRSDGEMHRILHRFVAGLKRREIDGVIPGGTPAEYVFQVGEEVDLMTSFGERPAKVLELPDCAIEDIDENTRMRFAIEMFGRPNPVYGRVGDARKRI